ncbi:uncharacterized protein LOC129799447 [Phlebotomus papatasi]|uniref:uncharacterized protein LOC129799447 n=1 Tax=Phlebotomus papatasi TaxID=29031 RepID=UPI0024835B71|nr:uncharacterized protein LOC129799447 [Phlebotomus papatasi]
MCCVNPPSSRPLFPNWMSLDQISEEEAVRMSGGELKVLLDVEECLSSKQWTFLEETPAIQDDLESMDGEIAPRTPPVFLSSPSREASCAPKGESSGVSPSDWWTSTLGIRSTDEKKRNLQFFHGFTQMEIVRDIRKNLHSILLSLQKKP